MRVPAAGTRRRLVAWVGRPWEQRGTQTYLTVLVATSLWLSVAHDRVVDAALRSASTNLDGLERHPVTVLLTSACWMEPGTWRAWSALLCTSVLVLAPVERIVGTARWLIAFWSAHVGATVLVALGLHIGVEAGWLRPAVRHSIDVGWSYGALGVVGAATSVLPRRLRPVWVAVFAAGRIIALLHPDFTEVGHALALAIGCAVGPVLAHPSPRPHRAPPAGTSASTAGGA